MTYVWWSTTVWPGRLNRCGEVALGDRHADGVREPLAEGPGRRLDARGEPVLGMPRRLRAPLPEALELLERERVAGEMEERVEEHRAVAGGEDEPVAVGPGRVGRMVTEEARPEDVGHRGRAHREARVARLRLLHGVGGQEADRVHAELIEIPARHDGPLLSAVAWGIRRS